LIKDQLRLFTAFGRLCFLASVPESGFPNDARRTCLGAKLVATKLDVEESCFVSETSSLTSGRFGWLRPRSGSTSARPLNATHLLRRYLLYQVAPTCASAGEHNLLTIVFDQWTCTSGSPRSPPSRGIAVIGTANPNAQHGDTETRKKQKALYRG